MNLNSYQEYAMNFALYPRKQTKPKNDPLIYTVLALCGEAGELANKLKKILRDDRAVTKEDQAILMDELSDVFWYVASTATELGYTLQEVAAFNLEKLQKRREKYKITG